jgi:hypothetical protein
MTGQRIRHQARGHVDINRMILYHVMMIVTMMYISNEMMSQI